MDSIPLQATRMTGSFGVVRRETVRTRLEGEEQLRKEDLIVLDSKLETAMPGRVFSSDQIKDYKLFLQDSLFGAMPFI